MSRAVAFALLLCLAVAAQAAVGARPVAVHRALTPLDPQFGDSVVATIDVVVDADRVDPASVRVDATFAPYRVVSSSRRWRRDGTASVLHVEERLRCLDVVCVPPAASATFRFPRLHVRYRDGSRTQSISVGWPPLRAHGRVTPRQLRRPVLRSGSLLPAEPSYRVPPRPTGYALLALAGLLAFGGAGLLLGTALRRRRPMRGAESGLERVLRELAAGNGDIGRRRRALEQLARELESVDELLSLESRALAWAPPDPHPAAVSELTSRVRRAVRG